jgi:hypothetical protein
MYNLGFLNYCIPEYPVMIIMKASEGTLMSTRRERTATMAAAPAPAACTRGIVQREVSYRIA